MNAGRTAEIVSEPDRAGSARPFPGAGKMCYPCRDGNRTMKTTSQENGGAAEESLSLRTKLGFGVCDLGGNLFFTIMGFYLLYYLTNRLGLEAGLAGTALMIGKVWDAVTDPIVGVLSDRTRTRWGRRKPWIFAGAVLLFFSMLFMFRDPGIADQRMLFLWAVFAYCLLNTAYTFVSIPYGALTPELTTDYHERSVLNGYRMTSAVLGTFIGAAAVLPLAGAFADPGTGWLVMASVMGGIMTATALVTVITVREPGAAAEDADEGSFSATLDVLKRKPFLLVLVPWALHITGVTVVQTSLVYYFQYVYRDREAFLPALILLLAFALVFIPVWIRASRGIGKKHTYNLGMGLFSASVLAFFFLGGRFGPGFAYVVMAVAGIGFSVQYAMPFAILPDVTEFDYAETGRRREGIYYGLWTFVSKLGQAFAVALSGWVLSLSGFVPAADHQGAPALLGIGLLSGVFPAAFCVAGIAVHWFYPIDRKAYEKIRERIVARDGR